MLNSTSSNCLFELALLPAASSAFMRGKGGTISRPDTCFSIFSFSFLAYSAFSCWSRNFVCTFSGLYMRSASPKLPKAPRDEAAELWRWGPVAPPLTLELSDFDMASIWSS